MAHEPGALERDHRGLGAPQAAARSSQHRHLLRRHPGARRCRAGRGGVEPRLGGGPWQHGLPQAADGAGAPWDLAADHVRGLSR